MAIQATKVAVLGNPDTSERNVTILFSLALSANYGGAATHGDTLNFGGAGSAFEIASDQLPLWVDVFEMPASGTQPSWYNGVYCPGTTRDNGVVAFALAGTEFTGGNPYTGALAAATFFAVACFPAFV